MGDFVEVLFEECVVVKYDVGVFVGWCVGLGGKCGMCGVDDGIYFGGIGEWEFGDDFVCGWIKNWGVWYVGESGLFVVDEGVGGG